MSQNTRKPLLSEIGYDGDAKVIGQDSDGEFESEVEESYNVSHLPNDEDRQILHDSEDEKARETKGRLGRMKEAFSRSADDTDEDRRRRRIRRLKEDAKGSESTKLIYKMETGFRDSSSRSSSTSIELLEDKSDIKAAPQKPFGRIIAIAAFILGIFFLLAYGSYSASKQKDTTTRLSNGTHTFGPTTILISLDGFRADFLKRGLTPTLNEIIKSGVSPNYMLPSFPSLTFPNHFTLVTGMYPESHGIVSNQFWDPKFEEEFYYTNISSSMQPKWWNAEPVWVTAEKQGLRTAVHMWPGSEAHIGDMDPAFLDKYNGTEALDVKVDRILQWLDLPEADRPRLIAAYVPDVDADGHLYGPNSTEIRQTIVEVDNMLLNIVEGLYNRNLTEIVNLIIVSDHGMATTSNDRLIQLDDLIDMSLVDHIDGWPLQGLRLKNAERDVPILHKQLLLASKDNHFDVYTRETMPERYHFSHNDRIAPLWVVPQAGWVVVDKADFDVAAAKASGKGYHPIGLHGYDHEHPLMRAIFVARGPAFPHPPNSRIAAFQNIDVYNMLCDSIGIEPHPNNGSMRLPLTTQGLHTDFTESLESPADPMEHTVASMPSLSSPTKSEFTSTTETSPHNTDQTSGTAGGHVDSALEVPKSSWWKFVHTKLNQAKEWAKEMIEAIKNNKSTENGE